MKLTDIAPAYPNLVDYGSPEHYRLVGPASQYDNESVFPADIPTREIDVKELHSFAIELRDASSMSDVELDPDHGSE